MAVDITKHLGEMLGQPAEVKELPQPCADWCMILVRNGYEQDARDALRRKGVGAWWPNYEKELKAREGSRRQLSRRSMFLPVLPGVVLGHAKLGHAFWTAIDTAPGVINLARKFNNDVILLTDLDIVLIHKIEEGLNRSSPPRIVHAYKTGDKVRFIDDGSRRFPAGEVFECMKDGLIKLHVNMMGRMTACIVAPWQVEPVDPVDRIRAKKKN